MIQSTAKRLTLPAVISCMGLAITQAWYIKSGTGFTKSGAIGKPLAILAAKNERIERRPTTRLIWESLSTGENLYGGEAVRTSSTSSGKITFLQSGMTIGLEPDSLVIIEETDGKLQLNLVNGGVFVKSDQASGGKSTQPVLKAGDKKIELAGKSSELNLSVGASGAADIQLTKGDAKIGGASGKTEILKEGSAKSLAANGETQSLEISGPKSGSSIPLTGLGEKINISWGKTPDGATVFLETGNSRDSLTRVGNGVPASARQISLPVKAGDFFWRLVAVKDGKIISTGPTTYNQGITLEAPKLLSNANSEKVIAPKSTEQLTVKLSWTRPQGAEDVTVLISKDPALKENVQSKTFLTETEWNAPVKEPGKYYWKTVVRWPGVDRRIASNPGSFEISTQKEIPAPEIVGPAAEAIVSKQAADSNGIMLNWKSVSGVESYDLELQRKQTNNTYKTLLTRNIPATQFRITNIPPGEYQWSVKSRIGDNTGSSGGNQKFTVRELPTLNAASGTTKENALVFDSPDSPITLPLAGIPAGAATIRYKIKSLADASVETPWLTSPAASPLKFKLPAAGSYAMTAEAVDNKQTTVAINNQIPLELKVPDLLPPPQLLIKSQKLKTGEGGDISLRWKAVPGAVRYIVEITGPRTNFRKEIPGTFINMNNLLPGNHTLTLSAVDKAGRTGTKSPGVTIEVPDVSGIAAPTTKGFRIK